jgi:hypothetical protein
MFESPESRGALEAVKAFVATHAPAGLIDERALILVGESDERIVEGLNFIRREMEDAAAQSGQTSMAVGFAVAFAALVNDRIIELSLHSGGRA